MMMTGKLRKKKVLLVVESTLMFIISSLISSLTVQNWNVSALYVEIVASDVNCHFRGMESRLDESQHTALRGKTVRSVWESVMWICERGIIGENEISERQTFKYRLYIVRKRVCTMQLDLPHTQDITRNFVIYIGYKSNALVLYYKPIGKINRCRPRKR
jgi:hypothetical protein